jgi:hypothetical protein
MPLPDRPSPRNPGDAADLDIVGRLGALFGSAEPVDIP